MKSRIRRAVAAGCSTREAGLLESGAGGYRLTQAGMQLKDALAPVDGWAKRWAAGRPAT